MQAGNPLAADATGTTKINIEQLFQGMILPGAPTPAAAPTPRALYVRNRWLLC